MTLSPDEVAGIVDLFGALRPAELDRAREEYGFRRDEAVPESDVEAAVEAYALVGYERDGDRYLAVGPAAFPALPEGAEDLPHILDVESRAPDRAALERAAEERFRGDVARAVAAEDDDEIRRLLDVSYDLEAWGDLALADLRARLDDALA
ncbi:DUF7109 family protein [Halosegnis marinus]|uniref:Uncharacterized protein n=1 Tax=Halosegnis marinus TaxID=3034023 RepID=A0ABD5ZQS2_9EURY|nr:hypothetical protein [Halosegnis sp. DT85]